jgi:spermidine synthase
MHGSTMHGVQSQRPEDLTKPCAYFHTEGPVGDIFNELNTRKTFAEKGRIGVVGLGTGAIAAYGRGGQQITFFEIDPAVERIAQDPQFFTYLGDCRARGVDLKVRLGDARLTLADEPDREFDVLFIDAFSSDAIPVHLLTREALQLFFAKLAETGLLAVHITNRHLDLEPVLSNLADDLGVVARIREDRRPGNPRGSPSTWVVLARHAEDIGGLQRHAPWRPATSRSRDRLWTDDFSSVVSVFRWDLRPSWLPWWKGPDEASDKPNGSGGRP